LSNSPLDFVSDSTDWDANIFPGANEIADNGIDEDCSEVDLFKLTKVFPNPVKDELNINFDYDGELIIQIFDVSGRLKLAERKDFNINNTSMNVNILSQGVYILRILDLNDQDLHHQKFVKH